MDLVLSWPLLLWNEALNPGNERNTVGHLNQATEANLQRFSGTAERNHDLAVVNPRGLLDLKRQTEVKEGLV